jgi:hypothetical protein
MRKLVLAIAALFFMAGLVVAAEVTLVKYDKDKKEITVKDGDKEKTYKVTDKTKFSSTDKDGNAKEATYEQAEKRLSNEKGFGKMKLDITTDGNKLTEVKYRGGKGKKQ